MNNKKVLTEYTHNGAFFVAYNVTTLEEHDTGWGTVEIVYNDYFGNMMFFDEEIQISSMDFNLFHREVLKATDISPTDKVLIVGDGDGGFTSHPYRKNFTYVERDKTIMDLGTKYFGAVWDGIDLHTSSIEDYLKDYSGEPAYDVVLLMVTDGFMRGNSAEFLSSLTKVLKPGGKVFVPTACLLDARFNEQQSDMHHIVEEEISEHVASSKWGSFYVPSFMCPYHYVVLRLS